MTFREMLAADMQTLLDTDVFGESATYTTPDGQDVALTVVLFGESTEQHETSGVSTKKRIQDCTWPAVSQSTVNLRAKLTIGNVDWSIEQVLFIDDTQVSVRLVRNELHEQTRPAYRRGTLT